ncbi:MAG: BfmA/BtgA family mobilization protein [Bacteroidota bacterium]|nr:BfmA/BtgA family mobilization protein [Bacteroidota bacterium]
MTYKQNPNLEKLKSIAIDEETHQLIKQLSKTNKQSQGAFVKNMAKYFSKYGVEPTTAPASLSKEIKNLDRRFISFIREQEERFLIPLGNQLESTKNEVLKIRQKLEQTPFEKTQQQSNISEHEFSVYKKIAFNIYEMGIKMNLTQRKEKIVLNDLLALSEKIKSIVQ